jgi:NAD-dependent deacetylase
MQCTACGNRFDIGYREWGADDRCSCGSLKGVKPDVVFFGEAAPNYRPMSKAFQALTEDDLLVVIGTSGVVVDVGSVSAQSPCLSVLSNLKSSDLGALDAQFSATCHGRASERARDLDLLVQVWAERVGLAYEAAAESDGPAPAP